MDRRGIYDYMPWYAWCVCVSLAAVAAVGLFAGLPLGRQLGLSVREAVLATAFVEAVAAVGIGGTVVYYHDPDEEPDEWRYYP
ncbi:MAG: formate hydrogenlyase subunit 3/multisubunit Na+/H+ antiporter MnhD subunit [Methanobacteriota archaeon]|jgi:formate hydrogenlyase subunit 3/multisubunit Na+/H+ antiporter MnhD subunit|uniref:Uncharacterized protein n=1 Tax=Halorutilus salinus TaxID=2487751 RepID=A0A9Q4C5Y4_9EURY|nr:hypothetical protein [Halorutilus salinus]MCX2819554.1 hypothetical protein [Halorutilus salinus]